MKSSELRGFSSVFKFTVGQTVKQKSFVISLAITMIITMALFPISKLLNKSGNTEVSSIHKVYVINETNIEDIPFANMAGEYDYVNGITFEETADSIDAVCERLEDKQETGNEKNSVLVKVSFSMETASYEVSVYYAHKSKVQKVEVETFANDIQRWFSSYKVTVMNVSDSVLENIKKPVDVSVLKYKDFVYEEEPTTISMAEYNVIYAVLMIFFFIVLMTSSLVANKVVEEKANRIVEYLLTTVRPMALMLGKVVAMLLVGVGEVVLVLLAGFASKTVSDQIWPSTSSAGASFLSFDGIKGMSLGNVIICIFIMICGVLIYSLLAGLFGASVSKMEDLQQGLKTFNMIILLAFFAAIIGASLMQTVGDNAFVKVITFVPFTAVMVLPGVLLIGKITMIELLIAIALLIATAIILLWFISRIYEGVIVSNGTTVSVKTMFSMAKDSLSKKGGSENE